MLTETQRQFWRESEQRWVDHVLIRTCGPNRDEPTRWRHRTITTVVTEGPWTQGKYPSTPPPFDTAAAMLAEADAGAAVAAMGGRAMSSEQAAASAEIERVETTLQVLLELSERRVGDGRLRDAIATVRDALWEDLDD